MTPMLNRREVLRTGTAIAVTAGVGALAADSATASKQPAARTQQFPAYANWIPDPSAVSSADLTGVQTVTTSAMLDYGGADESPTDPILANPVSSAYYSDTTWSWPRAVGLGDLVLGPANDNGNAEPGAVPTDRTVTLLPASGEAEGVVYVFLGSFDTAALESQLNSEGYTQLDAGLYENTAQGAFIGHTDGAVVIGFTADLVQAVVDTGEGNTARRHAVNEDFAWLVETGGNADLTYLDYDEDLSFEGAAGGNPDINTDYTMFEGVSGFGHAAVATGDGYPQATAAAVYPSADAVQRDRLTSSLGTDAVSRNVQQNGARIAITASYTTATPTPTPTPTAASEPTATPTPSPTPSPSPTPTTSGSGPGPGILGGLAGIAGGSYLLARRSRTDSDA